VNTVEVERFRTAAQAARARALACRARREQLQARSGVTDADVSHAREALQQARRRAEAAAAAVEARRLRHFAVPQSITVHSSPSVSPTEVRAWLGEHGLTLDDLHVKYLSVGGVRSLFDLDAFANGVIDFGSHQLSVLQHAMWELDEFRG
jgi:multidrug efflux pump subunit AcrA (membrane-fusion protein)